MATFVDYTRPADARTGAQPVLVTPRPNLVRERPTKVTLEDLARLVLALQDNVYDLVRHVTELPFGGPVVYLKGVTFAASTNVVLPHRIPVQPSLGTPGIGITRAADASQIRFFVGNMSAFGRVKLVSVDAKNVTLQSDTAMSADVLLMVSP